MGWESSQYFCAYKNFLVWEIMKTCELTGVLLDYWVSRIDRLEAYICPNSPGNRLFIDDDSFSGGRCLYSPSTDWMLGGPIIESEKISVIYHTDCEWHGDIKQWRAYYSISIGSYDGEASIGNINHNNGDTALEAAMRCFVASKFGDEVPDEVT
jgi:hypothetical protein